MPAPLEILADAIERLHESNLGKRFGTLVASYPKDPIKLLRLACLTAFCAPALTSMKAWSYQLNHMLMVWFHEGGHGVLWFAQDYGVYGRMVCSLGGSAAQIYVPLMFMAAVWSTGRRYDTSLMFLWLGINFADVSIYAADARARALPLIFNLDKESHDWGNILSTLNLLPYTEAIAGAIWFMGLLCFGAAVVLGYKFAGKDEPSM